jgi:hypothetical protein
MEAFFLEICGAEGSSWKPMDRPESVLVFAPDFEESLQRIFCCFPLKLKNKQK